MMLPFVILDAAHGASAGNRHLSALQNSADCCAEMRSGDAMKIWVAALAACMMATPALAAGEAKMEQAIGGALAVAQLCERLEPDLERLSFYGELAGIDVTKGSADYDMLLALARAKKASMAHSSEEATCTTGEFLYGENGSRVRGLLKAK
ncbi:MULTISPECIES: hypothetical protein [unclassified Rhizobium]